MVPQQSQDGSTTISQTEVDPMESMSVEDYEEKLTVFGSQQVKETSNTPYTDATQVSKCISFLTLLVGLKLSHFMYLGPPPLYTLGCCSTKIVKNIQSWRVCLIFHLNSKV